MLLNQLSSIRIDGARAITGRNIGFISLCRQDPFSPKFNAYNCTIHQQALCGNNIKFQNVTSDVIKIINSIIYLK